MNDDSNFEDRVNQSLDDSIDNLSPDVQRRLNQIRIEAVEKKSHSIPLWKTAGAMSFALAVALSWQFIPAENEAPIEPFADVLQEDLDMLDELEFVYWMAEENDSATL